MTNFNPIIMTTSFGLSIFFGIYSFFSLINYLEYSGIRNNNVIKEITDKYNDIEIKYNSVLRENIILKSEIDFLLKKVTELENKKLSLVNCVGDADLGDVLEDVISENRIVCNTVSEDKPKINVEIINVFVKPQEEEEESEEVKSEYLPEQSPSPEKDHGFEVLEENYGKNEHIVKSRIRGTSISEINWAEVTKKFIFG